MYSGSANYSGRAKNDFVSLPDLNTHAFQSQEKFTISGYVTETGSKENLLGVSIYVPELKLGTTTNDYGFFSLSLPEGPHEILISYVGYATQRQQIDLTEDRVWQFPLTPRPNRWRK